MTILGSAHVNLFTPSLSKTASVRRSSPRGKQAVYIPHTHTRDHFKLRYFPNTSIIHFHCQMKIHSNTVGRKLMSNEVKSLVCARCHVQSFKVHSNIAAEEKSFSRSFQVMAPKILYYNLLLLFDCIHAFLYRFVQPNLRCLTDGA